MGNIIAKVETCLYDNHGYDAIRAVYTEGTVAYLLGFPSITGKNGFDILSISPGNDQLMFVKSLTTTSMDQNLTNVRVFDYFKDLDLFVLGAQANKVTPNGTVRKQVYYCFKGSDLGIDFSLGTQEGNNQSSSLAVYPNPTGGVIQFRIEEDNRSGRVSINDLNGKLIRQKLSATLTHIQWTLRINQQAFMY
jgi:hypothetical protein